MLMKNRAVIWDLFDTEDGPREGEDHEWGGGMKKRERGKMIMEVEKEA